MLNGVDGDVNIQRRDQGGRKRGTQEVGRSSTVKENFSSGMAPSRFRSLPKPINSPIEKSFDSQNDKLVIASKAFR